jgi:hypothetical protein
MAFKKRQPKISLGLSLPLSPWLMLYFKLKQDGSISCTSFINLNKTFNLIIKN